MKDLLPALDLPTPLVIDFDYELNRPDQSGTRESHASHHSTNESVPVPPISGDPFHPSRYFEIPTITVHDEIVASPPSPTRSPSDSGMSMSSSSLTISLSPPPSKPLDWIWICHLCHSRYSLGATRRCLVDGHYYCSGESSAVQRNVKRRKRGTSCSSEFDYVGWKDWGVWKRSLMASQERYLHGHGNHPYKLKGCENCEYPSECRYEKMKQPTDKTATSYFHDAISPTSPPADVNIKQQDEDVEMSDVSDSIATGPESTVLTDTTAAPKDITMNPAGGSSENSNPDITSTNKRGADSLNLHDQSSACSILRGSSATSKTVKKTVQGRDKTLTTGPQTSEQALTSNLPIIHEENLLATTISTTATPISIPTPIPISIPSTAPNHTVKFETRRFYSTLIKTNDSSTALPSKRSQPPRQKQVNKPDQKSDRPARRIRINNNSILSSNFQKSTFQPEASKGAQVDTTTKNKDKITREDKGTRQMTTTTVTSLYRDGTYTRSSTSSSPSSSNSERSSSSSSSNPSTQNLIRDFLGFGKSS